MYPYDLIKYIVWYATQQGLRLTTNRLVKFVYLADLYNARIKHGETITNFPWRFINYGPYCSEVGNSIEDAVRQGLICKETFDSKFDIDKEYNLFWCKKDDAEHIENKFHIGVIGQLQRSIQLFGDDTAKLLDYVYFDTEPMEGVKKGELLSFKNAKSKEPVKKVQLKKLSKEKIAFAREKLKELSEEVKNDRKRLLDDSETSCKFKDDTYYKFIEQIDGEDLLVGLRGNAKIKISE